MQKIWDFILRDIQSIDTNVWIILGAFIVFFVALIIYQQRQKPKTIIFDDEISEIQNNNEISPQNIPESSEIKVWFFIDLCSILTITPFIYLYGLKKSSILELLWMKIVLSFIIAIGFYIFLVKPILFNTKQK